MFENHVSANAIQDSLYKEYNAKTFQSLIWSQFYMLCIPLSKMAVATHCRLHQYDNVITVRCNDAQVAKSWL